MHEVEDEFDWMNALISDPSIAKRADEEIAALNDPCLNAYLDRVDQAFKSFSDIMKKWNGFLPIDAGGLFQKYIEGRAWVICELNVTNWGGDARACLALRNCHPDIEYIVTSATERDPSSRFFYDGNKKPMLVDIAKFICDPEGMPITSLVCLHFVDEEILNLGLAKSEACFRLDLTVKSRCIVGEWEASSFGLSSFWEGKSYGDIIKDASQISDGISDYRINLLIRLMQRMKVNFFPSFPLINFHPHFIKVCRQNGSDLGLKAYPSGSGATKCGDGGGLTA